MTGPVWWQNFQERFWLGPEEFSGGVRHFRLHLATWVGGLWIRYFLQRKFTLPAIMLLPVAGIALLYAALVIHSAVLLPAVLLLSAGLTAFAAGFLFRPRGVLLRHVPDRVRAGETFPIRYCFKNARRMPVCDLVCDPFAWAPHLERVSAAGMAEISGGGGGECVQQVRAVRRGALRLYRPLAESAFPLGLVKYSVRGPAVQKLLIWPAFTPIEIFSMPNGSGQCSSGAALSAIPGDSPNLLGCRDFRTGDAIRRIDWAGSARRGALVVKEFAREEFLQIAVIADTCPPRFPLRTGNAVSRELEAAMSLAAALAEHLLRRDTAVDVLAAGRMIRRFRSGRSRAGFEQLCDMLAEAVPEKAFPAEELLEALTPELRRTSGAVVLLLDNTPERREFVTHLAHSGVALKVILLAEHPATAELPPGWRHIHPEEVFSGKITRL